LKKLLNTLYITSPDTYLSLDGENIVVQKDKLELTRLPLHNLESIITFGYTGASPGLMGACAKNNISLCFMTQNGKFLARITGEVKGNITLRKTQYRISDDESQSVFFAKCFLYGKIHNCKSVVDRAIRDYTLRLDCEKLKGVSQSLSSSVKLIKECTYMGELRGIEGEAAKQYFSVFDELILQQKEDFYFINRNKRPPLDNVNALLSFLYTLLANDVAAALESVGLDAYAGFLHRDRPGRISLALDLMEEFRPVFADRTALSLINKKEVTGKGFTKKESGGVIMDDDTRKIVLNAWQTKKKEEITHPFLGEKISWGLIPYAQAMLLARFLRGDLDAYPPFFWK
jgi:CRISPR-associated protein Cas1